MGRRRDELLERATMLPELRAQVERQPLAIKAQGVRIYDIDNIGYIDYIGGGGTAIVGYSNQFILDAVRKTLTTGVPDGMHVPQEVDLAESLSEFLPWVGSWWLCRSYDEALRAAVHWARRTSGKDVVLTSDGSSRPDGAAVRRDGLGGQPAQRDLSGWDVERVEAALTAGASKIAALVVDPLMTGLGVVPPPEGALQSIADVCRKTGVYLVFDERVTGFRVHRGGAVAWTGVTPDIAVYGGALAGGFPLGAVAFASGLDRALLDGNGPLPAPHAVSLAAAEAVLSILKNDTVYERLEERSQQLVSGILALAERFSRPMVVNRVGSVFALYTTDKPATSRSGVHKTNPGTYQRVVEGLLAEGVLLPQQPMTAAFVSSAHGAKDVEETLGACERVLMRLYQEDLP